MNTLIMISSGILSFSCLLVIAYILAPASGQASHSLVAITLSKYIDGTNNLNIEGEIKNNSSSTAKFVQIIGTFYDSAGQVVGTDTSFTNPSSILSGDKAPFHIILSKSSVPIGQITNYTLQVKSPMT